MFVSKEELEGIKKEHQKHLLNTKYLRSILCLYRKKSLKGLKKTTMTTFKGREEILVGWGIMDLSVNEYLFS